MLFRSMFHVNAWGLAHAGVASGAGLVMPGADLSGRGLANLIVEERVTVAAGVPTIWMQVLPELAGRDASSLRAIPCGGSAVPRALSEGYRAQIGLPLLQAWGMTETSPICAVAHLDADEQHLDDDTKAELRTMVGRISFGVEMRVVDPSSGEPVPWDGEATGELQCRGNWIAASYHDDPRSGESFTEDGWLRTGDVGMVDARGYVQLTDRTKDVIKSGGEWISSVDLEDALLKHKSVAEVAVVAVDDTRWQERPLAIVRSKAGCDGETLPGELRSFLVDKVAKFWVPEYWAVVDDIPKTSVGKMDKKLLREEVAAGRLAIQKHLGFGEVND